MKSGPAIASINVTLLYWIHIFIMETLGTLTSSLMMETLGTFTSSLDCFNEALGQFPAHLALNSIDNFLDAVLVPRRSQTISQKTISRLGCQFRLDRFYKIFTIFMMLRARCLPYLSLVNRNSYVEVFCLRLNFKGHP